MTLEEPARGHLRMLRTFHGDSIARVVYREIAYEAGVAAWRREDHHALDYGVELHLGSGRLLSFVWSWRSGECFLAPLASDLTGELRGEHAVWDVSDEAPWPGLLGQRISSTHLQWFAHDRSAESFSICVKLVLESGAPVYFALGEFSSSGKCTSGEAVSVFFSDAIAARSDTGIGCSWADA
jgi:hypothetical protein